MALIKCKECGHTISDKAAKCPNCGCPMQHLDDPKKKVEDFKPKSTRKRNIKVSVWILVIFSLLGGGAYYLYTRHSEEKVIEGIVSKLFEDDDIVELTPHFIEAVRKYDELAEFSGGFAAVCKDDKWGFINIKGEEAISCKYDRVLMFSEGLVAVREDDKWGFINTKGEKVIPCQYEVPFDHDLGRFDTYKFSEGLAAVSKDERWGFINKQGEEVVPFKYVFAESFSEGFAAVCKEDGNWIYINAKGEEVFSFNPIRNYDKSFSEGLAVVIKDGKYGFVNDKGEEIIACKYDNAQSFSEGLAAVEKGDKWCYTNVKGEETVSCESGVWYCSPLSEGFAVVSNGKCGFADIKGMVAIQCKYDYVEPFSEGLAAVEKNGKYGFINTKGEEVVPCKYDLAHSFSKNGVALAGLFLGDKWIYGFIDKHGNSTFTQSDFGEQIAYERQEEEKKIAEEEQIRQEEEKIRREGVERVVNLTVELTKNSHVTSVSKGAVLFGDEIFSKYIKIPEGKIWIYKREELKEGFIWSSSLLYYSKGNPDRGVIYGYNKKYKYSEGNVPILRSGDGFRIGIDGARGSITDSNSNNPVIYNVYFIEKDEEDYY